MIYWCYLLILFFQLRDPQVVYLSIEITSGCKEQLQATAPEVSRDGDVELVVIKTIDFYQRAEQPHASLLYGVARLQFSIKIT